MRKRYSTSNKKLPTAIILLLFLCLASQAEEQDKETNITCYAAKNKWICASDSQQQEAESKANLFSQGEVETSDVVIKPLNLPKFSSKPQSHHPSKKKSQIKQPQQTNNRPSENNPQKTVKQINHTQVAPSNQYQNYWTYQLIGVSTENNALKYVSKNNFSQGKIHVIKTHHNSMDWWIVTFGLYRNKQAAINDRDNLPSTHAKPWLRPLKNTEIIEIISTD
ncbi:MAG TPA: hypothetical protein ENJ44_01495 [Oceanospirillales bacterium]|nr:hypothetical protein [Oceanospirillales bacterium]